MQNSLILKIKNIYIVYFMKDEADYFSMYRGTVRGTKEIYKGRCLGRQ
jgi:hypothetical protein